MGFHKAKKLVLPENIVLLFQPPYSPEVNAAENIWAAYKRAFSNKIYKSLDEISEFITEFTKTLTPENIIKTTSFPYVKPCLYWTT